MYGDTETITVIIMCIFSKSFNDNDGRSITNVYDI